MTLTLILRCARAGSASRLCWPNSSWYVNDVGLEWTDYNSCHKVNSYTHTQKSCHIIFIDWQLICKDIQSLFRKQQKWELWYSHTQRERERERWQNTTSRSIKTFYWRIPTQLIASVQTLGRTRPLSSQHLQASETFLRRVLWSVFEHTVAGKTTTSENKQPFSLEGSSPWLPCGSVLGAGSVCQVFLPQQAGGRVEYMRVEFFLLAGSLWVRDWVKNARQGRRVKNTRLYYNDRMPRFLLLILLWSVSSRCFHTYIHTCVCMCGA